VRDRAHKKSRLYNYGEFSFDELMLARYLLGHLTFWVGERHVERTLDMYRRQGRTIKTLEIDLAPDERVVMARILADNVRPENKSYIYDHFTDNCATKPRDVIDRAIGGRLRAAATPGRMTLRHHALRYTSASMPVAWIIDFIMNREVDQTITTWEEAFLPLELERQVRALDLVKGETVNHATGPVPREDAVTMWPWLLALGTALGACSLALRHRMRALAAYTTVLALCAGAPGTALFVMWSFTDHFITYGNENILLSSPLTLLAAPLALAAARGNERAIRASRALWAGLAVAALVALAAKALPWFSQANAPHLALFVPAVLGTAVAWRLAPGVSWSPRR
jgi:hypothetical protein